MKLTNLFENATKYVFERTDRNGNIYYVGVWQDGEGESVRIMSWSNRSRTPQSLANHMFRHRMGNQQAIATFKGSITNLFFGDELSVPSQEEVLEAIRAVTKLSEWQISEG